MAEVEGKLLTCDLCGATVFLKYVEIIKRRLGEV